MHLSFYKSIDESLIELINLTLNTFFRRDTIVFTKYIIFIIKSLYIDIVWHIEHTFTSFIVTENQVVVSNSGRTAGIECCRSNKTFSISHACFILTISPREMNDPLFTPDKRIIPSKENIISEIPAAHHSKCITGIWIRKLTQYLAPLPPPFFFHLTPRKSDRWKFDLLYQRYPLDTAKMYLTLIKPVVLN